MGKEFEIKYTCNICKEVYDVDDLSELYEVDEGEYENLCPKCGSVLEWGIKECQ